MLLRMTRLALLLLLAACASPSPAYLGAEETELALNGARFHVFRLSESAQVIRMGETRLDPDVLIEDSRRAAALATGCEPRKVTRFDGSVIDFALVCE